MRRVSIVVLLVLVLVLALAGSALAAASDEHASCLGVGASSVAPGTADDVALFINTLANPPLVTHGTLVVPFAQQKGECVALPPVPPHP